MGMVYASMQYVWNVMTNTNRGTTEGFRRFSLLQIQRNTISVTTDYLILRAQEIRGGVAKKYITLVLGKVKFQVA